MDFIFGFKRRAQHNHYVDEDERYRGELAHMPLSSRLQLCQGLEASGSDSSFVFVNFSSEDVTHGFCERSRCATETIITKKTLFSFKTYKIKYFKIFVDAFLYFGHKMLLKFRI